MPRMNRRQFLMASGVTGGAALAAGATGVTWHQLSQRAKTEPLASDAQVLVVLTMYGGNDGLNTLVPYADPAYHDARPELAYAPEQVLHLDSQLGLNPSMTGMKALWQSNQLAIVRGVGYPKPDHSHFRSMDIWQTASPDAPSRTGWIGRYLDVTGDDPLRAVNIGSVLPPLAVGAKAAAAALPLGQNRAMPAVYSKAMTALGRADRSDTPAHAMVCAGYRAELQVDATFGTILDAKAGGSTEQDQAAGGQGGGQNTLKDQLDLVGRCVKAGVPTRVYTVSQGGFDTHADEKQSQQAQLATVDFAVSHFLADMAADARGRNVVLLAYSEFGRRVAANASQGTDHGTAGPVFVAGVPVKGGFYGSEPSLTDLDDGDLKASTDFRVIYSELLAKVLGTEPAKVLGSERPALGLIA